MATDEAVIPVELPLKCGITLHLQAVNMPAFRSLLIKAGGWDRLANPERLVDISDELRDEYNEGAQTLLLYVAGWGVTDDPPPEAIEELALLGWESTSIPVLRAWWVRYLLTEKDEIAALLGRVMILSTMGP